MACTGLEEMFRERGRRHFRSVAWFPVFALTVILANLPTSIHSNTKDYCEDGEYLTNELVPSTPGMINTDMTTNSMTATTWKADCRNCNETMEPCIRCELSNNSFVCQNCTPGYQLTDNNCTLVPHTTPKSDSTTIIIAVVVSIGGVIIIAIIVGIVFAARKGKLEKCQCACARSSPTPPPMPPADDLGVSFKKDDNESGTGQRVDLRYTGQPGAQQSRVESVHYDGFTVPRNDDDVYMNDIPMRTIPATVHEEEDEETHTNMDDEVYVNTGFSSPANQSNANMPRSTKMTPVGPVASSSNTKTTPVASNSKPPRPKPKPQTPSKPTKPKQPEDNRASIFPPEDPDDIYLNEQELKHDNDDDDDDDKEDYVNTEGYQPGKR